MLNFNDIALVWGESESVNPPAKSPSVSVSLWSEIVGSEWQRWDTSDINNIPQVVRDAKVSIVNLFHTADSIHIEQIRQVNPSCFILACPDPSLDFVLSHPEWMNMYKQMSLADAIGGRTFSDCEVYGTLLNKQAIYFPSPIGPTEYFLPFRELPKSDYLLTLDHGFSPANTVCNVAAVAEIQRKTDIRVLYVAERPYTVEYAKFAGLKCEWLGRVPFTEMVELTARAKLCVDIYSSHALGRQSLLCAMVGTTFFGSSWSRNHLGITDDTFNVKQLSDYAVRFVQEKLDPYIQDKFNSGSWREIGYYQIERYFSFDACRKRLTELLSTIEAKYIALEIP